MIIYLIPGLGVDERLFKNLILNYPCRYIKWIPVKTNITLKDYALELAKQIDTTQPFSLIGVSFGGMCAVEIAKVYKTEKLVLISSAKTSDEIFPLLKILRLIPIHKTLPDKVYIKLASTFRRLFGVKSKDVAKTFNDMLNNVPPNYFQGAVNAIINWKNKNYPPLLHIHGTLDQIIYIRQIKDPVKIEKGTHLMVVNRADEISKIINEYLKF